VSYKGCRIKDFGLKGIVLKGIKCCDSKGIAGSVKIARYRDYCNYCYCECIGGLYSILLPLYLLLQYRQL